MKTFERHGDCIPTLDTVYTAFCIMLLEVWMYKREKIKRTYLKYNTT